VTDTEAAELAMHIDHVGPSYGIRVVNGSGFRGLPGLCFAVELENGERRLITSEQDWRDICSSVEATAARRR
jgi:hypothetical protein